MVDTSPRRRLRSSVTGRLRRWLGRPSPPLSAAAGRGADQGVGQRVDGPADPPADLGADLIADIVAMTMHAAQDGLPLSAVLDDLRLVLHLGPADMLPVDALRACALEWARASQGPSATSPAVPVTLDDLEGRLWTLMGSGPGQLPGRVVVVRSRWSGPQGDDVGRPRPADVLHPADLLSAAAVLVAEVFDRPDEHVALLRTPPGAGADRLVVLLPGQGDEDGVGDEDRLALCRATLAAAPLTSTAPWVVEMHQLGGHPSGLLASIREALARD